MTFQILSTTASLDNERERRRLVRKLSQFGNLQSGWSHGEGDAVSVVAIAAAEEFLFQAARLGLRADVFPNLDGGCAVAFYRGTDCVEVSIHRDGASFGIRVERGIGAEFDDVTPPRDGASRQDAINAVDRLVPEAEWSLRVFSTSASSTLSDNASVILPFGIRRSPPIPAPLQTAVGGSQSLRPLAPARI